MSENSSDQKLKEKLTRAGQKPGAEEKVHKKFFDYFKKNESNISFGRQLEQIYDLLSSKKLNKQDKALIIGTLLYFINPFDILPDITPFVGFIDDMSVIALVYRYLSNRAAESEGQPEPEEDSSEDS